MPVLDSQGREIGEEGLPQGWQRIYRQPWVVRLIAKHFNRVYYANPEKTLFGSRWLGIPAVKYPTDLWIYQEMIAEQRPELIIETGTWQGGSAHYLATVCDALGEGRIVSIDLGDSEPSPHPRITYLLGRSSTDPGVLDEVRALAEPCARTMVILDSDHARDHVLAELRLYADLVHVGGYLVVEDTNVNGHPVLPQHGPGPTEALETFLREDRRFEVLPQAERLMLTANPGGFLRRVR